MSEELEKRMARIKCGGRSENALEIIQTMADDDLKALFDYYIDDDEDALCHYFDQPRDGEPPAPEPDGTSPSLPWNLSGLVGAFRLPP